MPAKNVPSMPMNCFETKLRAEQCDKIDISDVTARNGSTSWSLALLAQSGLAPVAAINSLSQSTMEVIQLCAMLRCGSRVQKEMVYREADAAAVYVFV